MPLVRRTVAFPAVLGATVLSVGCSVTPPQSPAQTAFDETVASTVYAALDANPNYFFRHVDVSVDNGVAKFSGYVWSTEAIYRARQIARSVAGVRHVVTSHLQLEREGGKAGHSR